MAKTFGQEDMMNRIFRLAAVVAASAVALMGTAARAEYPDHPVRLGQLSALCSAKKKVFDNPGVSATPHSF
jgi:hypothetical protein